MFSYFSSAEIKLGGAAARTGSGEDQERGLGNGVCQAASSTAGANMPT
jgi:hypothetical protein